MSKYAPLWQWLKEKDEPSLTLSFAEVQAITGFPMDHAFLTCKRELTSYGYEVGRISMKTGTVTFRRLP